MPDRTQVADLIDAYDGFLLDAYGVLKDSSGALPGAVELLARLRAARRPFVLVTNDASRLPTTISRGLAAIGLDIPAADIVTSGSLLAAHFATAGLVGARCMVLGPPDSEAYVRAAGGEVVPVDPCADIDVLVVGDDSGFDFLPGVEAALSAVVRALDTDRHVSLILPNPDLVYPKGGGQLGFTSGAIALLIETVVRRRYPARDLAFVHLGKPRRAMFDEARRRLEAVGARRLLMVGDQLETDIAGALGAGLDAALVDGVSRWSSAATIEPTWILASLIA